MVGRTLGHYRLLEQIGSGGMGVVYRARDLRLERDVALKVLPAGMLGDAVARRRFRNEALALSQLNHPNIATVHDFDTQDGVDFLVLEHVEGETLDDRLARGPLAEREVVKLAVQLAAGLDAAHQRKVVHRDLKPGNLRVTPDGRLKILDFGLARLLQPPPDQATLASLTETQVVVGTLAYMAPELFEGRKADARSDLHAAGAVLYEMATSRRPFPQDGAAALMYAIMNEAPEPPSAVRRGVSPGLESVIVKALEKDPDLRYQSARELRVDLERLAAPSATATRPRARKARARLPAWALAVVGLIPALSLIWALNPGGLRERISGRELGPVSAVAVMPLADLSGQSGQAYFADGMTDELITSLGKISALKVIARSSVMEYKGTHIPLRQIARALGVGSLLEGSVLRSQDRVRISVQLIRAATGKLVWSESYERSLSDVLALQSDVALAIAREIQVKITPQEQARFADPRPVNPQAHEAYLLGRYQWNRSSREDKERGVALFKRAIEIDPGYAPAYAGLADAYWSVSNWWMPPDKAMPLARAGAQQALKLDSNLADAHALMGIVAGQYDFDGRAAEPEFRRAIELNSNSSLARFYYGYWLNEMGRFDEAQVQLSKARELDPLASYIRWLSTWPLFYQGRYDQLVPELQSLIAVDPQFADSYVLLGEVYEQKRDYPGALAELRKAVNLGTHPWALAAIGRVHAESGARDSAFAVIRRLEDLAKEQYVTPYGIASIYAGLGNHDRAFELLERAYRERSEDLLLLKVDPRVAGLRSDPRFDRLLRRLGLPT